MNIEFESVLIVMLGAALGAVILAILGPIVITPITRAITGIAA
jgi:hypothetical protein